jgi:hypothetical protein
MAILFILIILFIFVYFIPTFIASRGYQNVLLVFLINFLLGWTGIGWVVALILAFGTNTKKYEELKFRERSRHIKGLKEEDILSSADNRRVNEMKMKAEEYKLRAQIRAEVEEEMKKEKIRKQYEDELRDN